MKVFLIAFSTCIAITAPSFLYAGGLGSAFSAALKKIGTDVPDVSDVFRGSRGQQFKWDDPNPSLDYGPGGSNGTSSLAQPLYPGLPTVPGGMPKN